MVAEERTHHVGLVGLVAPLHHRGERSGRDRDAVLERQRRERERRRALEIAGHQEPARRQGRKRVDVVARAPEIGGEQRGRHARGVLVGGRDAGRARKGRPATRSPAARAPASGSPRSSRATIAHRSCRGEAGRAAIRRDSRRCRGAASRARAPTGRALEFDRQAKLRRCAASIAASAGPGRSARPDAPRRQSGARRRRAADRAGRARCVPRPRRRAPAGREPATRFWISEVTKTVLPARERPVTPRRKAPPWT